MAEQGYKYTKEDERGNVVETKTIPIQDMTTRQLRKYIRENAAEANERLNTIKDLSDTSAAFQDQVDFLKSFGTGRGGGIKSDTSRIDKETMVEYAYALRDLNMLDSFSKYSRDQDYRENKQQYETFIKKQWASLNPNAKAHWEQYKTPKGNVSKKGYDDYKNYINWLKNLQNSIAAYGYEAIQDFYTEQDEVLTEAEVAEVLMDTYLENSGLGLGLSDLGDKVNLALEAAREEKKERLSQSNTNVKVKKARKLKGGTVRNRQTT